MGGRVAGLAAFVAYLEGVWNTNSQTQQPKMRQMMAALLEIQLMRRLLAGAVAGRMRP